MYSSSTANQSFLEKPNEASQQTIQTLDCILLSQMKHLFTLNKYLYKYRRQLILGMIFVVLSNIFRVLQPQAIRHALDTIVLYLNNPTQEGSVLLRSNLMKFGLLVLAYAVLMGIFMYFMRQTIIVVSRWIEYDLRKVIFNHYLQQGNSFFRTHRTGDLMSRISEDVNKVRMYLGPVLLYGINLVALFIVVIFTMVQVNPKLALFTLLPLPFLSAIIYWVSNKINVKSEHIQIQLAKLTSLAQEAFSGIRVIKSYAAEKYWNEEMDKQASEQKKLSLSLAKVDALFFPSMFLLIGISTLITIYIGGLNVYDGHVTTGNIAEFVIYVNMLTWPVSAIGWCASLIQQAEASQKRINEFLSHPSPAKVGNEHELLTAGPWDIEFENVAFKYPESGIQAIQNLNFKIKSGSRVAVVGKTGSGKSTLTELLLKFQKADHGKILINHIPIENISVLQLRSLISFTPQDVFLFSDTIQNNMLFAPESSPDSLQRITNLASLDSELPQFKDGYQTMIGERGVSLSGGQKQRVSLARALAKPFRLLILDDVLSAVDEHTERHITKAIFSLQNEFTTIFITHRLELCKNVDHVFVMDEGSVVESGTFESLMHNESYFFKLYHANLEEEMTV